ncbi:hypothetical protein RIF29_38212 [Crotalaria pallida]|uniref:Uncharacterized protein n=1 Tax=Crotalaria pallida TaxID=3830 RepID=A0AAN9E199_CROPI
MSTAVGKSSLEDNLMGDFSLTNLDKIKSIQKAGIYRLEATIIGISAKQNWYYHECSCKGLLNENNNSNYCMFCCETVTLSYPRYRIPIDVIDSTSTANLKLLGREASFLLKKPCSDLFPLPRVSDCYDVGLLDYNNAHPEIFNKLIGGHFIFKVEVSSVPGNKDPWQYIILRMFPLKNVDMHLLSSEYMLTHEKMNAPSIDLDKGKSVDHFHNVPITDNVSRKKLIVGCNALFEGQSSGLKKGKNCERMLLAMTMHCERMLPGNG